MRGWTTREMEYIDVFALAIYEGHVSYYRAMHLLTDVKPLAGRTIEAIRSKLKQQVKKYREV
jgi:hypothetical protein